MKTFNELQPGDKIYIVDKDEKHGRALWVGDVTDIAHQCEDFPRYREVPIHIEGYHMKRVCAMPVCFDDTNIGDDIFTSLEEAKEKYLKHVDGDIKAYDDKIMRLTNKFAKKLDELTKIKEQMLKTKYELINAENSTEA